ncbi:MAG: hypothetical protein U0457_05785 [Candidatus Sericytochromatia bacterium]
MLLNRRALFTHLKDNLVENIGNSIKELPFNLAIKKSDEQKKLDEWLLIGKLSDFPVNSIKKILNEYVVFSNYTGLFVVSENSFNKKNLNPRYFIKLENKTGDILLNKNKFCNDNEIFSIIKNDFVIEEEDS